MTHEPKQHWDRFEIKAEVHRRGGTLAGIALAGGLEPSSARVALKRHHRRGEAAIAAFLGVAPEELWPERYRGPIYSPRQQRRASPNGKGN